MIWKAYLQLFDSFESFFLFATFKRRMTSQEFICKNTNAPYINFVVVGLSMNHFWRKVIQSAAHCFSSVIRCMSAPSKIWQFDNSVVIQQIFRFNISMNYFLSMQISQCLNCLIYVISGLCFIKSPVRWVHQLLIYFTFSCKFKNQVDFLFIPEEAIQSAYIWVS